MSVEQCSELYEGQGPHMVHVCGTEVLDPSHTQLVLHKLEILKYYKTEVDSTMFKYLSSAVALIVKYDKRETQTDRCWTS